MRRETKELGIVVSGRLPVGERSCRPAGPSLWFNRRSRANSRAGHLPFAPPAFLRCSKGITYSARFHRRVKLRLSRNRHLSFNVDCQCCQSDVGQKSPNRNSSGSGFFVFCHPTLLRTRPQPHPAGGAVLVRNPDGLWRLFVGDLLCLGLTFSQLDHRSSFP